MYSVTTQGWFWNTDPNILSFWYLYHIMSGFTGEGLMKAAVYAASATVNVAGNKQKMVWSVLEMK